LIGENTLLALVAIPDVGDIQIAPLNPAERAIRVDGLLDGMPRFLPVLHLHGRVGWFRRSASARLIPGVHAYNPDLGIPLVMTIRFGPSGVVRSVVGDAAARVSALDCGVSAAVFG
jgi:hypothetical protein